MSAGFPAASRGAVLLGVMFMSGPRVLAQVADQAEHVLRDEAADSAAGVDADHHLAVRGKDELGRLRVDRAGIDERAPVAAPCPGGDRDRNWSPGLSSGIAGLLSGVCER